MRHKDPYRGYVLCGVVGAFLLDFDNLGSHHHWLHTSASQSRFVFFSFYLEFLRSTKTAYRTVVHNVLVGSVSFASPAKALHNASTAQEITVISPSAHNLSFRVSFILVPNYSNISLINPSQRWHDPSPMPPSPIPESMALPASPTPSTPASTSSWGSSKSPRRSNSPREHEPEQHGKARGHPTNGASSPCHRNRSPSVHSQSTSRTPSPPGHGPTGSALVSPGKRPEVITFDPLSNKSFRTAFILNRFTVNATILYCSNDLLISTTDAIGRSFYDFVTEKDEDKVRSWIQCVKGWGVNEKGQPSDGGFGFGRFNLLSESRDSVYEFLIIVTNDIYSDHCYYDLGNACPIHQHLLAKPLVGITTTIDNMRLVDGRVRDSCFQRHALHLPLRHHIPHRSMMQPNLR
jgi:hypothetical protein